MESPKNYIAEAERYLSNARAILKTKATATAGQAGNGVPGYYSDSKYVKMACNTGWSGVLVALDAKIVSPPKEQRKSVKTYQDYLSSRNKKILNDFISGYNHLHLYGGYDGELNKKTIQIGMELAENIIEWCRDNC